MTHEQIARICHTTNQAYRAILGEQESLPWETLYPGTRAAVIAAVRAITSGEVVTPQELHARWLRDFHALGFTLGPYDPVAKTHPNMVQYSTLPIEQRRKDTIFFMLVSAFMVTGGVDDAHIP